MNPEATGARKRAATTSDPKKAVGENKQTRHMEGFNSHIKELVEAFKKPVVVTDARWDDEKEWIKEAHEIWDRDFLSVGFKVANAMFEDWDEKPRKANTFITGSDTFRRESVSHVASEMGVDVCFEE